jgi:hypothetical protein
MFTRPKSLMLTILVILSSCVPRRKESSITEVVIIKNNAFFDVSPGSQQVSYLYAPGLMSSELKMGRYCPEFIAGASGERISWKAGGHVIGQPHSAVIFPEIDLRKPGRFTLNPITIISNRMRRDIYPLMERYMHEKYGITVIDNPESSKTVVNYNFSVGRINIAQENDIKALRKTYTEHITRYPNTDVVLYGDSRGAATIFNFIAIDNPAQVKAAVLEGIFDAMPHVMKHCIYSDKEEHVEKRLSGTLSLVMRGYKKNALSPRDYAEIIADDIPILLVTSLKDWVVPPQCTIYLYNRLRERGHQKVHLLILQHSSHSGYMLEDARDRQLYEEVVHAFYQRYGLPYNQMKAYAGQMAFASTQPSCEHIRNMHKLFQCQLCV